LEYNPSGAGVLLRNSLFSVSYGEVCLDVKGANPASNTLVDLFTCNGTVAQAGHVMLTGQ
jgi:hypothetical protein